MGLWNLKLYMSTVMKSLVSTVPFKSLRADNVQSYSRVQKRAKFEFVKAVYPICAP